MCILVEALERVEVGGKSLFFTDKTNGFRAKLYFSSSNSYHNTPNLLDFFFLIWTLIWSFSLYKIIQF